MRLFFVPRYLLGAALAVFAIALGVAATPAFAATPVIIEQSQASLLPAGTIATPWAMTERAPFASGFEHYTRTVGCGSRAVGYVAKCLSLEQSPPPAGSTVIYDPEGWTLTSVSEHADYCAGMQLAATLIRQAGATPIIAPPSPTDRSLVQCAAANAATVIFQAQPEEADAAAYMHVLRQATRWARAVRPGVQVAFVLSTASRYGATPADLVDAYTQAEAYLGGAAAWWLNIIPEAGDASAGVPVAESLLAAVQS